MRDNRRAYTRIVKNGIAGKQVAVTGAICFVKCIRPVIGKSAVARNNIIANRGEIATVIICPGSEHQVSSNAVVK